MYLTGLNVRSFRCLQYCAIEPTDGINCVVGDNASGKTSLLESIYLLGRGQSFQQKRLTGAIRQGDDAFSVHGRICGDDRGASRRIACHVTPKQTQFKLDGQNETTRFDLVGTLPLQHIDPNVHRLLELGPQHRRHFLDWGVFHVEHAFFPAWRRYRRALKQRNRALRSGRPRNEIITWDTAVVENGEIVDACRRRYLELVMQQLPRDTHALIGESQIDLQFYSGWRKNEAYGAVLASTLSQDIKAGFTQSGPHRADIRIRVASERARDWVSRGQQKILSAALMLAQARILYAQKRIRPILLIDDLAAELGIRYRSTLAEQVVDCKAQAFVTFLDKSLIPSPFANGQVFHVEQGRVSGG